MMGCCFVCDWLIVKSPLNPIYRCTNCGFEINVYKNSVPSDGFKGYCPRCNNGELKPLETFYDELLLRS